MKRFLLIVATLSILAACLVSFSGNTAFAADRTALAPQHMTIATDTRSFGFNDWWGWGVCLSERDTRTFLNDANTGDQQMIISGMVGLLNAPGGAILGMAFAADNIHLRSLDHGRGICMATAWGAIPWDWSR